MKQWVWMLLAAPVAVMAEEAPSPFQFSGDVRGGYFSLHRDDRDGSENITDEFRMRLRLGVGVDFDGDAQIKARWAGRYSTIEGNHGFHFDDYLTPGADSIPRGQSTLDELYYNQHLGSNWNLRVGRFQTKFELDGVAKKSLDRNNSPNVDITWTDGLYLTYTADAGWKGHMIVQHNSKKGSTELRRLPLDFADDGSRYSLFAAWENNNAWGPVIQRGVDVTYLPDALHDEGVGAGSIDDYVALVGRIAARWPMGENGMKFQLGGELGYAPDTQTEVAAGTGTSGDVDGHAFQITANFLDIKPRHSFGMVYAQAESGWLISPDFRSNNSLIEGRYLFKIDKKRKFEARLRKREDLDQPLGTLEKREDVDLYLRYTQKF